MKKGDLPWDPKFDMEISRIIFFSSHWESIVLMRLGKSEEFGMLFVGSQVTADVGTRICLHIAYSKSS